MTCTHNILQIWHGKQQFIPFKIRVNGQYINLTGKTFSLVIADANFDERDEDVEKKDFLLSLFTQ